VLTANSAALELARVVSELNGSVVSRIASGVDVSSVLP
jgi:hypothetical protein